MTLRDDDDDDTKEKDTTRCSSRMLGDCPLIPQSVLVRVRRLLISVVVVPPRHPQPQICREARPITPRQRSVSHMG